MLSECLLVLVVSMAMPVPEVLVGQPPEAAAKASQLHVPALHINSLDGHPISAQVFE